MDLVKIAGLYLRTNLHYCIWRLNSQLISDKRHFPYFCTIKKILLEKNWSMNYTNLLWIREECNPTSGIEWLVTINAHFSLKKGCHTSKSLIRNVKNAFYSVLKELIVDSLVNIVSIKYLQRTVIAGANATYERKSENTGEWSIMYKS